MSTYYAVRKGRNPGIYKTWSEAEEQIHGYSGAQHKKFHLLEDAKAWMKGETMGDNAGVAGTSRPPRQSEVADQKPRIELRDGSLRIPAIPESIPLVQIAEAMGYECPESVRLYLRFGQDGRG